MIISRVERIAEQVELGTWKTKADFESVLPLTPEQLKRLIEKPPKLCDYPDQCVSRYLSGTGCRCIRSLFESEEQYDQWHTAFQETVKRKLKQNAVEITEIKI